MNYDNIINDYFDGQLDSVREDEVLSLLADNEQFRNEFKSYLALERTLRTDAKNLTPPSAATVGIFSKLGFNTPVPVASPSLWTGLGAIYGKFSQAVIGGLVASLLTASIFILFDKDYFITESAAPIIVSNQDKSDLTQNNNPISNNNGGLNSSDQSSFNNPLNTSYVRLVPQQTEAQDGQDSDLKSTVSEDIQSEKIIPEPIIQRLPAQFFNNFRDYSITMIDSPELILIPESELSKLGLSLSLFGNSYLNITNSNLEYASRPRFSNTGISADYQLSSDLRLLLDFRQEHYFQEFQGKDEEGYALIYRQFPNFFTGSAGIKYYAFNSGDFKFFGQGTLGFNQAGLVGRMMLGTDFYISKDYKLIIGIEGSSFTYFHRDTPFNSYKVGLTYGIGFDL